jgi:hypothetical protein
MCPSPASPEGAAGALRVRSAAKSVTSSRPLVVKTIVDLVLRNAGDVFPRGDHDDEGVHVLVMTLFVSLNVSASPDR